MSRFNFRLRRVLDLKEQHAKMAAIQVSIAQVRANQAHDAHAALAEIRQAGTEQLTAAHSGYATAGQMRNISFLMDTLDQNLNRAADAVASAQTVVTTAQGALTLAHQARRSLDKLRERQKDQWQHSMSQADRQQMDALALTLHSRPIRNTREES